MTSLQKLTLIACWAILVLVAWELTQTLLGTTVFIVVGLTLFRWAWKKTTVPTTQEVKEIAS